MERTRRFSTEAGVGLVIVAALALLTWLTFQVGEFRFGKKGYQIEVVFKSASGLEPQAKVRIAGVEVGTVEKIFLQEGMAHVLLRLRDDAQVHEDSVVMIASTGILAERHVEVSAGTPESRRLRPGEVIRGREILGTDELIAQIAEVAQGVKSLTASLSEVLGGDGKKPRLTMLLDDVDALVNNLNALVEENRGRFARTLEQMSGLAGETAALVAENREGLRGTVANLRDFSATLSERAQDLSGRLEEISAEFTQTASELRGAVADGRSDLKGLMESLRGTAAKAESAAGSLQAILARVERGEGAVGRLLSDPAPVESFTRAADQIGGVAQKINEGQGTLGRLVTDDKLLTSLEEATGSLNDFLSESKRMELHLGFRGEYLAERGDMKNYVTVRIRPRPEKYYLLELVDDPAGKRSVTETTTTLNRPEGEVTLQERQTVDEQTKLKFSVQFARSFGPLTFRAGLVESTGGAALDYGALAERLRLSFEAFDFAREEDGPHLKFTARYNVYKDLIFVTAGVDDPTADDTRSFFAGAGIIFSDEDLKSFLSLAKFGL